MSEIIHRLSNYDVRTIGKFEAALRKEFDLKVVFRLDHHKEHCTNDANLRDICAAFTEVKEITPTFVRQVLSEKMVYMRYPRGTAYSGRCPKDLFGRPEKSQVVVVSLPKKAVVKVPEVRLSPFEQKHNIKELLAGLTGTWPNGGKELSREVGGEFIEKYLTLELTSPTGDGKLDALLNYLVSDPESVLVAPAVLMTSIYAAIGSKNISKDIVKRLITESRLVTLMCYPEKILGHKPELDIFMQAKVILGYHLSVTDYSQETRTRFFQRLFDRRGVDQKILLVN